MQIGHRWTRMYLIEKHMCHTFKNNSYVSIFLFVLSVFLSSVVHSLKATCGCDAAEDIVFPLFPAVNGDTEARLEHSWTPFLTRAPQLPPPSLSPTLYEFIGGTSRALWEAINECVAWRVVMRDILQPFIRAGRHLTGGQPTGCVII